MVSVLLPFHNAARTLDTAVASIVAQTYGNWRLLLIDNASMDPGGDLAQRWAHVDSRITVVQEPRIGIAYALNTGLACSTSTYIARMDADDIAHPERLDRQVAYLEQHREIGVLGTCTRFASTVERSAGMASFVAWQNAIRSPHDHDVKRFVDAPLAHPSVMFRRSLVDRYGAYDEGPLPEDHELWLRWMHHGVRFAKLPEALLTWNDHAERLSRTHANYREEAFFSTKMKWLALFLEGVVQDRQVIIAGTSALCRERAARLEAEGIRIHAFTDVRHRQIPGYDFIPHEDLPPAGQAFIVSFISQRGTGDRIAAYLSTRSLVEGVDFILAA